MYVEDVYNARDVLMLSANSLVWDGSQIDALKRQGVHSLFINIDKGRDTAPPDVVPAPETQPLAKREEEYYKELRTRKSCSPSGA